MGTGADSNIPENKEECEMNPFIEHWINFCQTSKRGLIGLSNMIADELEQKDDELESNA